MPHFDEVTRLGALFSDVVSVDRFMKWKVDVVRGVDNTLSQYAFGEIFWKKALGRPNASRLSEGFTVEAWRTEMVLVGDVGGAAHWQPVRVPYLPSWWDGKDDGAYWRVVYMVPNLPVGESSDGLPEHSTYTHILPHLRHDIGWEIPGGRFGIGSAGLRGLVPPEVVFVKKEAPVHFSFEVVLRSLFISP